MEQIKEWKSFYIDLDLKKEQLEREIFRCNQIITTFEKNKKEALESANQAEIVISENKGHLEYLQSQLK